jgi:hypothetical protein
MKKTAILLALLAATLGPLRLAAQEQQSSATEKSTSSQSIDKQVNFAELDKELAQWRIVKMPFNPAGLTVRERKMVAKLVDASHYLEDIFLWQSDPEVVGLIQSLENSKNPQDKKVLRMLRIMGSRYDLLAEDKPFIGTQPMYPGRGQYASGLTREQIEQYVKEHPESKAQIYNDYTIVRRKGDELVGVPYNIVYKAYLESAARNLRQAADLSSDKDFANFLRLRADALLSDDYYKSDLAWVGLKDPKIDIIFAPYETYLDGILGTKTSYGAAVLIRDEAQTKKLAVFQKYVPDIQDALPLPPADRPSKKGLSTPMEVMNAPFRGGDLRHGYQAVADNLPNDPRIHEQVGTKKIFFKNFMDARVNYVILPLARIMMRSDQASSASGDGYLADTMMHEISHGIGPAFAHVNGKQEDIREAIGPLFSGLEEAKADVVGMYGLKWLVDHGALPKERLQEYYASYVGGIFRTVRFSIAEAHGRAEMMEFNYLSEQKAITQDPATHKYVIDYEKMPTALAALAKELLEIEATGDRARAESWFGKYQSMPPELQSALQAGDKVPVDIDPIFSFPEPIQ